MQISQLLSWFLPLHIIVIISCSKMEERITFDEETEVSYSYVMSLNNTDDIHPQGGDCFNDYFFQFTAENRIVRVYDLKKKILLQECKLDGVNRGFVPNCHCNSVNFGTKYYSDDDEFPLIYVSTGYGTDEYTGALAYRVLRENGLFSFSLVQTLRFPRDNSISWTEFVPAGDDCLLCYTGNGAVFRYAMPSVSESDVLFDDYEPMGLYKFQIINSNSRKQDRLYYKGKIIYISGVPQSGESSYLVFMDLASQTYEHVFNLKKIGLFSEPESVFIWEDSLCIAFGDQIVNLVFTPAVFPEGTVI